MFYIPKISSSFQCWNYRRKLMSEIQILSNILKIYFHWIEIYRKEHKTDNKNNNGQLQEIEIQKYEKLLTIIEDIILDERRCLRE